MKFIKLFVTTAILVMLISTQSFAAVRVTNEEAQFAENSMNDCSGDTKRVIECVETALDGLAKALRRGDIPANAPKASQVIRDAVNKLKKVKSKSAALSVLSRTRAILRSLSAKSSGKGQIVYKRIALTFSKALRVIKKKA